MQQVAISCLKQSSFRIFFGLELSQTPIHIYIYISGCVLCGPESLWRGYCTDVQDLTPQICHMRVNDRTEEDLQVKSRGF